METRKLSLQEMEIVEGGWSWAGCAAGAFGAGLTPVIATIIHGLRLVLWLLVALQVHWNKKYLKQNTGFRIPQ